MKVLRLIPHLKPKSILSKKQMFLAACFSLAYYFAIIFLAESNLGQVVQFNMATSLEFKAKSYFEKAPQLHEKIKILSIGDQSVAFLNRNNLFLHEWIGILSEIAKYKPSKIIVDKIFGVTNRSRSQVKLDVSELAKIIPPIVTGAFLSPNEIPKREALDISKALVTMEKKLGIGLDVINPKAFSRGHAMPSAVSALARHDKGLVYARHKSLKDAFFVNGFYNYNGKLKFSPFVNFGDDVVFPHAAMLAAEKISLDGDTIKIDGYDLPLNSSGSTLINIVAKDRFFKRIDSLINIKKFPEIINEGDIVVILPNMYTGSTDFHDSPIGYVPGGYFIVSIINSILSGEWLKELGYDWLQLLIWSVLGLATALFLSSSGYWLTVFVMSLLCVGSGIYVFTYYNYESAWWWSLICFLGISLSLFIYKSMFFEKFKEINDEIKDILNSIDQAIFTFNHDLSVNAEISKKAGDFFNPELFTKHSSIEKIFSADDAKLKEFFDWKELMFKEKTLKRWSKFEALAPIKQFEMVSENGAKRVLAFEYKPILRKDALKKIMVLGKDITARIEMERQIMETQLKHEAQMQRMLAYINHEKEMVRAFIAETKTNIKYFSSLQKPEALREDIDEAYRQMHTLKGNAGSFGFQLLAKAANHAEEYMAVVRKSRHEPNGRGVIQDENGWLGSVEEIKEEILKIEALGDSIFQADSNDLVIDRKDYIKLLARLESTAEINMSEILCEVKDLSSMRISKCLKKYEKMLQAYRDASGKNIADLMILTPREKISKSVFQTLDKALVHLVRNAMDHGIESREEREALEKGPGKIEIGLYQDDGHMKVILEDDGRGIDPEKIYKIAVENKIVKENSELTKADKLNLIFLPGFSSRDKANEISGRGVGMDVVEKIVTNAGGKMEIDSKIGRGTRFVIYLPVEDGQETEIFDSN